MATDLRQLALDIVSGKVFGSWNLLSFTDLPLVFMPLALGAEVAGDVSQLYEYLSEACPRSINGMPVFMSFRTLTETEARELKPLVDEAKARNQQFISGNQERSEASA